MKIGGRQIQSKQIKAKNAKANPKKDYFQLLSAGGENPADLFRTVREWQ
jgi:hypothetical protein